MFGKHTHDPPSWNMQCLELPAGIQKKGKAITDKKLQASYEEGDQRKR